MDYTARLRTPPLEFIIEFVLERSGKHANSINLKRRGTAPLVAVIRIHALAASSQSQNSFQRLDDEVAAGFLSAGLGVRLRDALVFLYLERVCIHTTYYARCGVVINDV